MREENHTEKCCNLSEPPGDGIPRPVEALLVSLCLLLAAPLILLLFILVACSSRGPIIFRQARVGRHGRTFTLYKLRTMRAGAHAGPLVTARGDCRVTHVGAVLRRTKLDELPELWNVFKGDMSLVGPRPEVPRYVDLGKQSWQEVLQARPGLTDPVTIRLRDEEQVLALAEGDRERFYLEELQPLKIQGSLEYLRGRTWLTDVRVICQTVLVILPHTKPLSFDLESSPGSEIERAEY